MKVLVLHNNNLPICLYYTSKFNLADDIFIETKILKYDGVIQSESFDEYISINLADISDAQYDAIVLPFSFSIDNYLEFSGLRIAAHLRLTPQWKKINTPILFVGPEDKDDICTLSPLSSILYANRVFTTDSIEKSILVNILHTISSEYPISDETENLATESSSYYRFLDSTTIQAPANFDSRHSIANQWAIYRWEQLFKKQDNLAYDSITHSLYIKHLIAKNKKIEFFSKKFYRKHPSLSHTISDIQNKHLVYIDDEESKGWGRLLENIIINSKATLSICPFDSSCQNQTKDQLIESIKSFINQDAKKFGIADCYIIDLRLHEEDSNTEIAHTNLSGHIIAEFIKTEINQGCQILIFTASNKSWNVQNALVHTHVADYIVKESPEMGYSSNDTYLSLGRFMASIKKAIDRSYIKDIYSNLNSYKDSEGELNLLYEFAELLNLDNGEANPTLIKSCALNIIVFLENFLKTQFEVDGLYNLYQDGNNIGNFRNQLFYHTEVEGGYKNVIESAWFDKTSLHPDWKEEAGTKSDITKILAPLYLFYGLDNESANLVVKLKHKRNTNIAHGGQTCDLSLGDLRNIYDKVICKILKKSFSQK